MVGSSNFGVFVMMRVMSVVIVMVIVTVVLFSVTA